MKDVIFRGVAHVVDVQDNSQYSIIFTKSSLVNFIKTIQPHLHGIELENNLDCMIALGFVFSGKLSDENIHYIFESRM